MKTFRLVVLAVVVAVPALADEPLKSAFGPGEQSSYVVTYLGVPTGEFQLTVGMLMRRDDRDVWPILCTAHTDLPIYPVNDRYVSYWDPYARKNIGADFWIDENRKKRREIYKLNHATKKAYVKRGEPLHEVTYDITAESLDVPGATMWLRNIPLKVGDKYERPVFTGAVSFTMTAAVEEKLKIKTKLGEREVFKVRVSTEFAGQLKQKRDLVAYLSADAYQIPLRVEADLLLGQVEADLVQFEAGRDFTRG